MKKQFDGTGEYISPVDEFTSEYEAEFIDLIMNAVKIEGLPFADEYFVKKQIFGRGYVGYSQSADKFFATLPEEKTPQDGRLWYKGQFKNERNISIGIHVYEYDKDASGDVWRLWLANPSKTPLFEVARHYARLIAECDIGAKQNICATRTPAFWVSDDPDFNLSLNQAIQKQQLGEPVVIVDKSLSATLSQMKNETPFLADKFNEMKKEYRNEFLSRLGIMTANTMKRERVQTAEVNAGMGEAVDLIYTVIDFWNKQAESYGLEKYKMTYNGVSEEYYEPEDVANDIDKPDDKPEDENKDGEE